MERTFLRWRASAVQPVLATRATPHGPRKQNEPCISPPRHGGVPKLLVRSSVALEHRPVRSLLDELLDEDEEATDVDVLPSRQSAWGASPRARRGAHPLVTWSRWRQG
jgi:hypothetical protein